MSGQEQKKAKGFSQLPKSSDDKKTTQQGPDVSAEDVLAKMNAVGKVKVIHGANDDEFEAVGATVSAVRANLVDAFNIPADALAFVDGEQVDNEYSLKAGETLEFVKAAGVKGAPLG
jgi:hypothetical protein